MDVRLQAAQIDDKAIIRQLLEFNAYEFSKFDGVDLDAHGSFGYRYLDHYWTEPERHPFLIMVAGHIAGTVLVRAGPPHAIAEFLILPKYRRQGVGTTAAREVFALFHGQWNVHETVGNVGAVDFWRKAIPVPFSETRDNKGTTQRFVISPASGRTTIN